MRDPYFLANPSASPEQGANVPARQEIGEATFISTDAKCLFVGSLVWLSLFVFASLAWIGAWSLGVTLTKWMGH